MSAGGMWRSNATTLFLLILLSLGILNLGEAAMIALGVVVVLVAGLLCFRQGMAVGHEACGIRSTVETLRAEGGFGQSKQDRQYAAQAWSQATGVKGMLLSALIPYLAGCFYIICTLLKVEPLILPMRVIAWLLSLPWWCVVIHWQPTFEVLTGLGAAVLMITPFILPGCFFAGYMQGPRLWQHTEEAMHQGRRRAKARSRVARKRVPKAKKPEV